MPAFMYILICFITACIGQDRSNLADLLENSQPHSEGEHGDVDEAPRDAPDENDAEEAAAIADGDVASGDAAIEHDSDVEVVEGSSEPPTGAPEHGLSRKESTWDLGVGVSNEPSQDADMPDSEYDRYTPEDKRISLGTLPDAVPKVNCRSKKAPNITFQELPSSEQEHELALARQHLKELLKKQEELTLGFVSNYMG